MEWDVIKRSNLDVSYSSQVYELMKKSFQSRQEGHPLSEYYNELSSIFLELDYRKPNDMECTNDIKKLRKRTVEDRIYIFLAGLDHNLDQVSGRILATSPSPSLEEAYSQVHVEEQRPFTMGIEDQSKALALTVQKKNSQPASLIRPSNHFSHFYTHCNSKRHTENVCWKKHGYPVWFKLKQAEKKNKKSAQVVVTYTPPSFASHVTQVSLEEGNSGLFFISASTNTWVIDSRAIDHMTSNPSLLNSLIPSHVKSVQVANGTPMPISGSRNVSFSSTLSLSFVLLAPNLSNNLLSISKITKNLNCSVTFHATHCVFQDNLTKTTISIGKERGGLYYLEGTRELQPKSDHILQVTREMSNREKILLWHCRLSHPSFPYLERLFPHLFKTISVSSLQCEQCIYAKNHLVPFKISLNKVLLLLFMSLQMFGALSLLLLPWVTNILCPSLMIVLE